MVGVVLAVDGFGADEISALGATFTDFRLRVDKRGRVVFAETRQENFEKCELRWSFALPADRHDDRPVAVNPEVTDIGMRIIVGERRPPDPGAGRRFDLIGECFRRMACTGITVVFAGEEFRRQRQQQQHQYQCPVAHAFPSKIL